MEQKKYYLNGEISEDLYLWLKAEAEKDKRSMTQEFIWILEKYKQKGGAS